MSGARWTPGPWRLAKPPSTMGLTVTLYGPNSSTLGIIHTGSSAYVANAALIAAAPDLYAALEALLESADRTNLHAARAALRRARGEP